VDFHPKDYVLACVSIDGSLSLHRYSGTGKSKSTASNDKRIQVHDPQHSCRAVKYSGRGDRVFTTATDGSLVGTDVETEKVINKKKRAHEGQNINRIVPVSETLMASGDEVGCVKFWDIRQQLHEVACISPHEDYVTDMFPYDPQNCLLTVSGDGTLANIDLRNRKLKNRSETDADDELLSVTVIKSGRKIVCGTTSGVLNVWSWGYWNDCSDRFPGHPDSVTCLLKIDEDTILSASSDGLIRVLSVQPNKMLGILGEHGDLDVERITATADQRLLASMSHDSIVKVWDLGQLMDADSDEEPSADSNHVDKDIGVGNDEQDEKYLQTAQDESDSDSDSGQEGKKRKRKKRGQHRIPTKARHSGADASSSFFSDLLS
jgi:hypothetical protein